MNKFIRQCLSSRSKVRDWRGEGFVRIEQKFDGHRTMIIRDLDGEYHAFGRKADIDLWTQLSTISCIYNYLDNNETLRSAHESSPIGDSTRSVSKSSNRASNDMSLGTPQDVLLGPLAEITLPPGTAVDGELYVPSGGSQDVRTAMNTGHGLRFVSWDIPYENGHKKRFKSLEAGFIERDERLREFGLNPPESYGDHFHGDISAPLLNKAAQILGWEGFVVKASVSHGWWRVKEVKTVDCIITHMIEGQGRLAGTLGSFKVALVGQDELIEIANVGTGFSDAQRHHFWSQNLVGQVIEVAYDSVQVSRLRFPRFLHFRDDKNIQECLLEQLQ